MDYKRFLSPYYISNVLLLSAYPVSKIIYNNINRVNIYNIHGTTKEETILFMLIILLVIRYFKSVTVEHFFNDFFFFSKISIIALYMFSDISVSLWYGFACMTIWFLFK